MSEKKIDKDNKPEHFTVFKWERESSPWHRDFFPDEFKDVAPIQGDHVMGWMGYDYYENPVMFIADDIEQKNEIGEEIDSD